MILGGIFFTHSLELGVEENVILRYLCSLQNFWKCDIPALFISSGKSSESHRS